MSDAIDKAIDALKSIREDVGKGMPGPVSDKSQQDGQEALEALQQLQRDYILVPRSEIPTGLKGALRWLRNNNGSAELTVKQAAALLAEQMEDSDNNT